MADARPSTVNWQAIVARYTRADLRQAVWQLANTLIPFVICWVLMYFSLRVGYWLTLLLAFPAAGFMVRAFIIFHDCAHGSFFKSQRANNWLGGVLGVLCFTPYYRWRNHHAIHHATASDLDRRSGDGDIFTLTVAEYRALPWHKRLLYGLYRHPLMLFTVGAPALFLFAHRFAYHTTGRRERYSVYWTNLGLLGVVVVMALTIGWQAFVLIQLPIIVISSIVGVWLFYVQHQFEDTYYARHANWSFVAAALEGSSYYQLPKVLQWFTGNIGFHHVHHLCPRIPNYNLEKCHRENELFQAVKPMTLLDSLRTMAVRLWHEDQSLMVGFMSDLTYVDFR